MMIKNQYGRARSAVGTNITKKEEESAWQRMYGQARETGKLYDVAAFMTLKGSAGHYCYWQVRLAIHGSIVRGSTTDKSRIYIADYEIF